MSPLVGLAVGTVDGLAAGLLGLSAARPAAAFGLLLPVVFLLLLRLATRPPEVVIGTLELWNELPRVAPRGARARRRPSAWALCCALALLAGALAGLGPRWERAAAPRRWTCVVDRSPSMSLPNGSGTRLDSALQLAEEWLAAHAARGERVRWRTAGQAELELGRGERPGATWLLARAEGEAEPDWERHDRPGTLWITDREPPVARAYAGLFASGGAAVPGPIAADGRERVLWEGGELVRVPSATPGVLSVRAAPGRALPAVLERVLTAWCEARGFELVRDRASGARLVLELVEGDEVALELVRDGWHARARGGLPSEPAADAGAFEDWLSGREPSGAARVVVRARPGRLQVGLRELAEPSGDAASFALSWAALLDRCALPGEDVVPLEERLAAGERVVAPGVAPPADPADPEAGAALDAGLALGAALMALLALFLRARA